MWILSQIHGRLSLRGCGGFPAVPHHFWESSLLRAQVWDRQEGLTGGQDIPMSWARLHV